MLFARIAVVAAALAAAPSAFANDATIDRLVARRLSLPWPLARRDLEEAPGAYKDVGAVVDSAEASGLAKKVAFLKPMICVKG